MCVLSISPCCCWLRHISQDLVLLLANIWLRKPFLSEKLVLESVCLRVCINPKLNMLMSVTSSLLKIIFSLLPHSFLFCSSIPTFIALLSLGQLWFAALTLCGNCFKSIWNPGENELPISTVFRNGCRQHGRSWKDGSVRPLPNEAAGFQRLALPRLCASYMLMLCLIHILYLESLALLNCYIKWTNKCSIDP